jgi:hypothetical protein
MTTTGVVGGRWRATVAPWGAVEPWDGSPVLDWHIAADDRWHSPAKEPTVRQTLVGGVPVVETRVRIPSGDAVQRVWSVADGGGYTVMSVANESPLPVAVAFTRPDLCSARPATDVPIQGIDLPAGSVAFPIGHHSTVTVALSHRGGGARLLPAVPSAEQVVAGWTAQLQRAGRMVLPDEAWTAAVSQARSELMLRGPSDESPLTMAHGIVELVRLGEPAERWMPELAEAAGQAARRDHPLAAHVMHGVRRVFVTAGEQRALRDVDKLLQRCAVRAVFGVPDLGDQLVAADVESRLATDHVGGATLLAGGVPAGWLGMNFEVHSLPVGVDGSVSYAIRWHGERPAVLWEAIGNPIELRGPGGWRSEARSGEALWHVDAATV